MVDLYLGLTTLHAAVFAIFVASLFVVMQAATQLFSPFTLHFLWRRKFTRATVAFPS
jgi:hypothetical protein